MDFNLTNGTISSLTITTDKNIDSATVTGADYTINENTITLTNLTSNLVLELTGESSSGINKIHLGTLNTKNFYFGTLGISKIYLGQYLVYAKGAPTEGYFKLSDGKWLYTSDGKAFKAIEQTDYTVTINFTNSYNTYNWDFTNIYNNYTIGLDYYQTKTEVAALSTDEIGSLSSADGSVTVTTTTGKILIFGVSANGANSGNIITSGGIETLGTYDSQNGGTGILSDVSAARIDGMTYVSTFLIYVFNITADGTITINGTVWHD